MVVPTSIRFPETVDQSLTAFSRATASRKSTVVVTAVREWLQCEAHPLVRYVSTNTGERRAALLAGPQVWTVVESWLQHEPGARRATEVAEVLGLTLTEVEAALAYWADNEGEIDGILERHSIAQEEAFVAWERRRALDERR